MERFPFAEDEWYHCYSRGIDKRKTFISRKDYERFISLLYLCNSEKSVHRSNLRNPTLREVLSLQRKSPLVSIGSFSLMPNHFHLLIKEIRPQGISAFMHKVGTAYTMYFNVLNRRTGSLFTKPFRSRHVDEDGYFQHALQYIHCNPAELFEQGWKDGVVSDGENLHKKLVEYPYGSLGAFHDPTHMMRPILGPDVFEVAQQSLPERMVKDALEYYQDCVKATP